MKNIPPQLLKLKFANRNHNFGLWFPLILLAPFVLLFLAIFLPFYLVAILVLWPWDGGRKILRMPLAFYQLICALRGLTLDVQSRKAEKIYITFA